MAVTSKKKPLTVEEKISRLKARGWEIETFFDADGNQKINARFHQAVGRQGAKRTSPLYNLYFKNKHDLVRELYYSSVGTQKDLAQEYNLTQEEISYIKTENKTYCRNGENGESIRVKVNAGRMVGCIEDIRFYLSQIQHRPYNTFLRKETMSEEDWLEKIKTMCTILTNCTGIPFYVEYTKTSKGKDICKVYSDEIYPIHIEKATEYPRVFAYLNSLLQFNSPVRNPEQRVIIRTLVDL